MLCIVSMVGFGLSSSSILTTVLSERSASLDSLSCESPFSCRNCLMFFPIVDIVYYNVWKVIYCLYDLHINNISFPFFSQCRRISENPQSETRPHSSPDPSCGREISRGRANPYPQSNVSPCRVRISFQGSPQNGF